MSIRSVVVSAIALGVLSLSTTGEAQQPQPRAPSGPSQPPEVLPPADSAPTQGGNGPATGEEEKKKPVVPAAGYAYSDKPAARAPAGRYRAHGPQVNIPGFEQTTDGGSRLFVQLSQSVPVEERKAQGAITYVLKGASPRVWNNTNALVTVHFNTPVSRARLVPQGKDLHFIVELRAGVAPTWKMNESQDHSAMLAIDFPKGDYLNLATGEGAAQPSTPPPPKAVRGRRGTRPAPRPSASDSGPRP
jgi:hypothetical protein